MVTLSANPSAKVYDFVAHRMQRVARQRRVAGATQRFLWGYPGASLMQAVEFNPRRQNSQTSSVQAR